MSVHAALGLRERKKADTRRALSDAAIKLAFEHGFDVVTREAIASLAGVSLRTFNNYFNGKYEALGYRQSERMRNFSRWMSPVGVRRLSWRAPGWGLRLAC